MNKNLAVFQENTPTPELTTIKLETLSGEPFSVTYAPRLGFPQISSGESDQGPESCVSLCNTYHLPISELRKLVFYTYLSDQEPQNPYTREPLPAQALALANCQTPEAYFSSTFSGIPKEQILSTLQEHLSSILHATSPKAILYELAIREAGKQLSKLNMSEEDIRSSLKALSIRVENTDNSPVTSVLFGAAKLEVDAEIFEFLGSPPLAYGVCTLSRNEYIYPSTLEDKRPNSATIFSWDAKSTPVEEQIVKVGQAIYNQKYLSENYSSRVKSGQKPTFPINFEAGLQQVISDKDAVQLGFNPSKEMITEMLLANAIRENGSLDMNVFTQNAHQYAEKIILGEEGIHLTPRERLTLNVDTMLDSASSCTIS
jgi:hypothetical protein